MHSMYIALKIFKDLLPHADSSGRGALEMPHLLSCSFLAQRAQNLAKGAPNGVNISSIET